MPLTQHLELAATGAGDAYRVEHRDHCTLLFGVIPVPDLVALSETAPEKSVMSTDLAQLAGATFAFGQRDAVEALSAKLRQEKSEDVDREMAPELSTLSPEARQWLIHGEHGMSAATIFTRVTGMAHPMLRGNRTPTDFPWDPADLRRCRLLLEAVPDIAKAFPEVMRPVSALWERLVDAWPHLCEVMDNECPNWRIAGHCPRTYARMKQLQAECIGQPFTKRK